MNCYDRIAHAMASLIYQAFGVQTSAIKTMLGAIENMIFFLRTGFGDSTKFAGSGISIKTQGMTQGNGASPAGWVVISICIIKADGKKGHGAKFLCPITRPTHHLSPILYINDTDLLHIDLKKIRRWTSYTLPSKTVSTAREICSLQRGERCNQVSAFT